MLDNEILSTKTRRNISQAINLFVAPSFNKYYGLGIPNNSMLLVINQF